MPVLFRVFRSRSYFRASVTSTSQQAPLPGKGVLRFRLVIFVRQETASTLPKVVGFPLVSEFPPTQQESPHFTSLMQVCHQVTWRNLIFTDLVQDVEQLASSFWIKSLENQLALSRLLPSSRSEPILISS